MKMAGLKGAVEVFPWSSSNGGGGGGGVVESVRG